MKKRISLICIIFTSLLLLILFGMAFKGNIGNPIYYQSERNSVIGSPFETSGSASRFALTESIVKNKTFSFTDSLANFSAPDIVYYQGKYFSIFTPGVSFLGVPLYYLGNLFGLPQLFSYQLNIIFALINLVLISFIAIKLGAKLYSGIISGLIFIFATNSLPYALTFTQHQTSTTFILLIILNSLTVSNLKNNILLGTLLGFSLLMDIPNLFIIFPFLIYRILNHITLQSTVEKFILKINFKLVGVIIGILPILIFYGYYNHSLTGSYIKIGQNIGYSNFPAPTGIQNQQPQDLSRPGERAKGITLISTPYNPRQELFGMITLLVSSQRGLFYYSPILLFGLIGIYFSIKKPELKTLTTLMIGSILIVLISYSMFPGPEGGWAFGPRYMIPASAILSCFIGVVLEKYVKKRLLLGIFLVFLLYSLGINILGALTTNAVPPEVEASRLSVPIPPNYQYNIQLLNQNFSSSLVFNLLFKNKFNARTYYYIYFFLTIVLFSLPVGIFILDSRKRK